MKSWDVLPLGWSIGVGIELGVGVGLGVGPEEGMKVRAV